MNHTRNSVRRLFASLTAALTLSMLTVAVQAEEYSIVPEQFGYCVTCHGVELQGNRSVDAPRLNGLNSWYVRNQLVAFRNGWRGTHSLDLVGMEMRPQATVLDDAGVEAAVAFVSQVAPRTNDSVSISGDVSRGAQLYATCAACHGDRGAGNETLQAPRLAGQSDWYLVDQLEKFRLGARGSSADDTYGAQMRASVSVLPNATAINDVVAYINTLR